MPQINGWMSIPNPYANAIFARAGWDSVTLDAQHGLYDDRSLSLSLQALSASSPRRLVRVRQNDPALIGRALDASADGIIVPLVNSEADARRVAEACYYPPRGARSFGPGLAALRAGAEPYMQVAQTIEVLAMVETRAALACVSDIVSVPGITGVYVGPNDLALSLGHGAGSDREEPELLDAYRTIIAASRAAGKIAGVYCTNADYAARMATLGFTLVTAGTDTGCLSDAAEATVSKLRLA
jgi:4-hydroxy-2-oxoheptanedioate aldolase